LFPQVLFYFAALYVLFISLSVHLFSLAPYTFIHRHTSFIFASVLGSFHCAFSTDTTEHRAFTSKGSAFIFGHFAFTTDTIELPFPSPSTSSLPLRLHRMLPLHISDSRCHR
jgi:hypothetical protein